MERITFGGKDDTCRRARFHFLLLVSFSVEQERIEAPGNAMELGCDACFLQWQQKYGDVYTFWMGDMPMVAVCDYDLIMEHFQRNGEDFQDRPDERLRVEYTRGHYSGILNINGALWKNQRRFALQSLRDFGLGKDVMEQRVCRIITNAFPVQIIEEYDDFLGKIRADQALGVVDHNLGAGIDRAIGSITNNLLFGYRYTQANIDEFKVGNLTTSGNGNSHI